MASELVKAAGKLTAVPAMPGGIVANVAEHLQVSSSARIPVSAMAALTSREEAAGELTTRVVFHGVPTREEAREATSELVDVIGRMYPWSGESGSSSNSQVGPAIALGSGETITGSQVHPFFHLLQEPAVQNVVRSLATDPNMFEAIGRNQEFRRQARQPSHSLATGAPAMLLEGPRMGHSSNDAEDQPGISFEDLFTRIHGMVDVIMKSMSGFVRNLFGGEGASSSSANGDHGTDPGTSEHEHNIASAILALVIMTTMMIFLRRAR